MQIKLERSGGFTGIPQTHSVSTDQLSQDDARQVSDLVRKAGFYELPATIRSTQPGADRFQYDITVESERGAHKVTVEEGAVPSQLQPLLEWMKKCAPARAGK
jgi:Emfourin